MSCYSQAMTGYPDHHCGGAGTGHGPAARLAWPVVMACLMLAVSGATHVACAMARHGAVMRHGARGLVRRAPALSRAPVMSYVPPHWSQHGVASWYGRGRGTASGEAFDPDALTAAHTQLPFGTRLLVRSRQTGRSVIVRVNDRGPFGAHRILDLSREAARQLGMLSAGTALVDIELADEEVASAPR